MGTQQLVYTATGTETASQVLATGVLPIFSAPYTFTISRTTPLTNGYTFQYTLVNGNTSTTCLTYNTGIAGGASTFSEPAVTPGGSGLTWHCTNWTLWQVKNWFTTQHLDAGAVYTFSITAADLPNPPSCQYGTRPKAGTGTVLPITGIVIDTILNHFSKPWLGSLFGSIIGSALRMDTLCASIPPAWPPINVFALLESDLDKLVLLQALAWHVFCECVPGSPPPIAFVEPAPVQPPDWPVDGPYPCTNSDICTTLLEILKRLDQLSGSQTLYVDHRVTLNQRGGSLAYTAGTVHDGLASSGTLTIAGLVGIRLQLTAGIPGSELEGTPPYIWDVGWMSVSDGGAMLQERRITRAVAEWFPTEMQLATVWGYFFKSNTIATMTELVPVSP
jgi:hypothetical protein